MKIEPMQQWTDGRREIAAADCAEANCFYGDALLDPALAQFGQSPAIHMIDIVDGEGMLIARLPVERRTRHGRYPVAHVANWAYPHCYYGAPVLRAGHEQEGWRQIFDILDTAPWSGDFLHLRLVDPDGPAVTTLAALCAAQGRQIVEIESYERAMLKSGLSAEAYWTETVRSKKRKELRRQQNRLAECGTITRAAFSNRGDLKSWCDAFLALERSGWKGKEGTALGSSARDEAFFRDACAGAAARDELEMLRIDSDGMPIAMLVNFVGPRGGFSFKIAIDPAYSRYSPGVLIEIDNLARVLDARRAPWMDSCAAADHPMIDSLWGERRTIAQYRITLRKPGLRGVLAAANRIGMPMAEKLMRLARRISPR